MRRVVRVAPDPDEKRRVRRSRIVWAAALLIVVAVAGGAWWLLLRPESGAPAGAAIQVEIPTGASSATVGHLLAERGVVDNALMFRIRAKLAGADGRLKSGVYDLTTGTGYEAVIAQLKAGPPISYVTITIPEGWTIDQVAARVARVAGVDEREFADLARTGASQFPYAFLRQVPDGSLEGYLFPKTYRVREGATPKEIIDVMLRQFAAETAAVDLTFASEHELSSHEIVVIASMIERECRVSRDRPLVSSVVYNRLERGMYLEIDATVQYALGGKPRRLLYRDLRVKSPYNTYLHKGLPPGPICSPGIASIKAAAKPASTGYLYYVLTHRDGTHTFARTLGEFERLKARAKRGLK